MSEDSKSKIERMLKDEGCPPIMERKEVAGVAGVTTRTVKNWEDSGLERIGPVNLRARYSREDVAAFLAARDD